MSGIPLTTASLAAERFGITEDTDTGVVDGNDTGVAIGDVATGIATGDDTVVAIGDDTGTAVGKVAIGVATGDDTGIAAGDVGWKKTQKKPDKHTQRCVRCYCNT